MKLVRWPDLQKIIGGEEKKFSRSTCDRWEKSGLFPKRIKIGRNMIGWDIDDINNWLNKKKISLSLE